MRVWKYTLRFSGHNTVDMPRGAKILRVDVQHNVVTFWALVDPKEPSETRRLRVVATGEEITERNFEYVGTFFGERSSLVFHVFEVRGEQVDS